MKIAIETIRPLDTWRTASNLSGEEGASSTATRGLYRMRSWRKIFSISAFVFGNSNRTGKRGTCVRGIRRLRSEGDGDCCDLNLCLVEGLEKAEMMPVIEMLLSTAKKLRAERMTRILRKRRDDFLENEEFVLFLSKAAVAVFVVDMTRLWLLLRRGRGRWG
jgi:hypothetical protein